MSTWVSVIDLRGISPAILDSFRDCELVESVNGIARYERVLRFRMSWTADDAWYLRPRRDADVEDAGPGAAGFMDLLMDSVAGLWLDVADDWDVDVRQVRTVVATRAAPPTALVMDGYEHLMVAVLRRDHPGGGRIRLRRRDDASPYWERMLRPGQAVVVDPRVATVLAGGAGRVDLLVNGFARTSVTAAGLPGPATPPGRR